MRELASLAVAGLIGVVAASVIGSCTPERAALASCSVLDGDTLHCRDDVHSKPFRIRLNGIDAPELPTTEGFTSTANLNDLMLRHSGRVRYYQLTHDRYGRVVAQVYVGGRASSIDLSCYQLVTASARYMAEWDEGNVTEGCLK